MIITIDGPVASGKSSVARLVAKHLHYFHISSGFLYRALAYEVRGINPENIISEGTKKRLLACTLNYTNDPDVRTVVWLNGKVITYEYLETEAISAIASRISAIPEIREHVLQAQHRIVDNKNTVIDGRDCGTVVFPNAEIKFFLKADPVERARRLCQREHAPNEAFEKCLDRVNMRDKRDADRIHSPMKPAEDAIIIDNTHLSLDQTLEKMLLFLSK